MLQKKPSRDLSQKERFIEAARAAEADATGETFERVVSTIIPPRKDSDVSWASSTLFLNSLWGDGMSKFKRSKEDLEAELVEQVTALRASASAYDADRKNRWEAKRLAATAYILLHDGPGGSRTRALLRQTGRRGKMKFLSTKVVPPAFGQGKLVAAQGALLVSIHFASGLVEYVPHLGHHPFSQDFRWLSFQEWWEESLFHPFSHLNLSRKNLVFTLRTQDGGGHVDRAISNAEYASLKTQGDGTARLLSGGGVEFYGVEFFGDQTTGELIPNGVNAHMRQIAWELDESLKLAGL